MTLAGLTELVSTDEPDEDLERALAFLGTDADVGEVARVGYVAVAVVAIGSLPLLAFAPSAVRLPLAVALVALLFGIPSAVRWVPLALARARRTHALGDAPDLVARAVLRMRIEPSAESAAAFAARTGDSELSDSLNDHVRRSFGSPNSGLTAFATEWGEWNPSLRRATLLVAAAADAPPGERERTLDRALAAILDGTRERMAEFVAEIRGPATAIYAFGVLLPLALVAVLPAARAAGVPVSPSMLIVAYDLVLPVGLVCVGSWLLSRRPVAFPPPTVTSAHPAVPDRRWVPLLAGPCAGGVASFVAGTFLPPWCRWVALLGCAGGTALVAWARPIVSVRNRVRAVERHLTDALYLVGRRVKEGVAVELALDVAADEVAGETGAVFGDAARIQRQLRTSVRRSFLGEHGSLADVPSPRTRSAVALLSLAAREGRPVGSAVVAMADHIDDLRTVDRETRRELAQVTGTLRSTASVFAPLVSGATVALADGMVGAGAFGGAFPTDVLGLAVGIYVLLLSVVLVGLSTGLECGLDRTLVAYRVGRSMLSAVCVYLLAFVCAGVLT